MATFELLVTDGGTADGSADAPLALGELPTAASLDDALRRRDIKQRLFGTEQPVTVGRYEVSHRLGTGGMGVVYAARDPELDRLVALKLMRPGHPLREARTIREARALAKLAHPNVVAIHEVGSADGHVFVAMELVVGATLRGWLERPRTLAEIAAVFVQAARGLAAAHEARLVHRDFKPENVIIGRDGRLRVVDFGLALAEGGEPERAPESSTAIAVRLSQTGELMGTPAYMAPEQLLGRSVDARTDVFAFCVALYEALHGARPYLRETIGELIDTVHAGPEQLAWRRDLPRPLVTLLRDGLAPDPERRLASIQPLLVELERIATPRVGRAMPLRAALGGLALGGAALAWFALPPEPAAIEPPVAAVVDAPDDAPWMCPAEPVADPRSCEALAERLMIGHDAAADHDTRCAFRRACASPVVATCPAGTEWTGSTGCMPPACAAEELDDAAARCKGDEPQCCALAANLRFATETPADVGQRTTMLLDELARGCAARDASACSGLGSIATMQGDDDGALAARVDACMLGDLQACRRIAVLPQDRARLDEACVLGDSSDCDLLDPSPVQLVRMAECRMTMSEVPAQVLNDEAQLAVELARKEVGLAPGEAAALDRAEASFRSSLRADYVRLARELGMQAPESLRDLHERLDERLHDDADPFGVRLAVQRAANTRAHILPSRPAVSPGPIDRWFVLQDELGARLERAVALELGPTRAAELHRARGAWPNAGWYGMEGSCPP